MSHTNETQIPKVVKTHTTPSLSGKFEITYSHRSNQDDSCSIQLTGNTGAGQLSSEWIGCAGIQEVLPDRSFNSIVLRSLFQNRTLKKFSSNTNKIYQQKIYPITRMGISRNLSYQI